ncbi:MAG: right-handed parallel beta-helix repeat-containing protein [Candidatus Hodarchaeales archaeon]|jgi:parallel beta-helix repeat protein
MLDKINTAIIYNKNCLNKFKFLFIIILIFGMNGWAFEQNLLSNSNNDLSTRQIYPLVSPLEEKNTETDDYTIQNENFEEQIYPIGEENENFSPFVETKIMAPDSQTKDAIWYYDNLTPEDRKKIRQAMDFAIPRDQIYSNIMNDTTEKIASPIGQHITGIYDPSIQARNYDQTMALDLLEQVFGYRYNFTTDPYFKMTLIAPDSIPARIQWATLTTQKFAEIGIDVELKLLSWAIGMPRIFTEPVGIGYDFLHGGFDAFFVGWNPNSNMNYTDLYHSESFVPNGSNYHWLNNSILDTFLDQAYTARQLNDRIQALKDFQAWFFEEVPKSMVLQFLEFFGIDPLVEGLDPSMVGYGPWVNNITVGTQNDLTYTVPGSFIDFNPAVSNWYYDSTWAGNIYLSLAERRGIYNSTHPVPLVAESWTSSSDGLEWNVTIRDGIKWDDGTDLTVDDVIYTYHAQFQDTSQSKNQYLLQKWFPNNISDIVKLNDSTIQFTTGSFNPFMESQIFGIEILPKAQMELITDWRSDNTNNGITKLLGCGPYMFKSYNGYDTIELEVNPYYDQAIFGHDPNAIGGGIWWPNASIPTVFFKTVYSAEEAVTGLETGLYDIIDYNTGIESYIEEIESSTWGKILSAPIGAVQELGYNQYSPIWGMNPKDPRTMYPEHDLEVSLETLSNTQFNVTALINTTITNYGWANETDVELQIWIDETLETTQIYPFMLGSSTEIFTYPWTPTEIGKHNVTAYVVPRINETNIENNTWSAIVTVTDSSKKIGIILSHGEYMSSNLRIYYESLGYVVDNIYTTITSSLLNNYSYIFAGEGGADWLESETISVETYVQNGGIFIGIGDTPPVNGTAKLAGNYGISFLGMATGGGGSTTNIDSYHPLMEGVTWIYIPDWYNILDVTSPAQPILWDNTGSVIIGATIDIGSGHLLVISTDLFYNIYHYDNELIFFNILKWLYWQPQEHDLSVSLSTPSALLPSGTTTINVTVENRGLNNETDVELQLWINGTLETSQIYSSFLAGATETISYIWTPTLVGEYNVTAYALTVTNETSVENNIVTNSVFVNDPILDFDIGDYIQHLDVMGQEFDFKYAYMIDDTHVRVEMNMSGMAIWLSVNIITGLIEDGFSSYLGYYYFGQIRTDIGVGDTINWFSETGTVVGTTFYEWNGTFIEAWNISVVSMDAYNYYHKDTGVWLFYYASGADIHMVDTNMIVWQPPEHEIRVELDIDISVQPGEIALINATVYNEGINNEVNVELILYLDEVSVSTSGTIATLLAGDNVSIQYAWNVEDYGTYNFTAYSSPVINETYTLNNIEAVMYEVIDPTMRMGFISTHGEYSLTNLRTYYGNLGYDTEIINSDITNALLRSYQFVFVGESGGIWTANEIAIIENYILNGGIFIGIGDSPPSDGVSQIAVNHGITFTGGSDGYGGSSAIIDSWHPLMINVTNIYIPSIYNSLEITGFAEPILWDSTGLEIYGAAVNIGNGHLLVLADDFDGTIYSDDNELLFLNILLWPSWEPPAHDLAVYLNIPTYLNLNETKTINATVINRGLNNEDNVELQLWINEVLVDSEIYLSLLTGTSETLVYQWTPLEAGIFNISAGVIPVTDENQTQNNFVTRMVAVSTAPITISSDSELAAVASSGTGTEISPYIMEGLIISTQGVTGIFIQDTTKYFIIRNCWIDSGYANGIFIQDVASGTATLTNNTCIGNNHGIYIMNSPDSTINNNNCSLNSGCGIYIYQSDSCTVIGNIFVQNGDCGIWLDHSPICIVEKNTCNRNYRGIEVKTSGNSIISQNICNENSQQGIWLWAVSFISSVTNNTCKDNRYGIQVDESNNCLIKLNTLKSSQSYGIYYNNVFGGTIEENLVTTTSYHGIQVLSSTNLKIISNILHDNGEAGIELKWSSNNIIGLNIVFNNNWDGIRLYNSNSDNTIEQNTVYNNGLNGIRLEFNNKDNIVDTNMVYNNGEAGIWVYSDEGSVSDYDGRNIILNNNVYDNNWTGIFILWSYLNEIAHNTIYGNQWGGIQIESAQACKVYNNEIYNNLGYGIRITDQSKINVIKENTITDNPNYGISIESSTGITVKDNDFINNKVGGTSQANDDGLSNVFENNYWDDWTIPDADADGIVDNPYPIDGSATNNDPYPRAIREPVLTTTTTVSSDETTTTTTKSGSGFTGFLLLLSILSLLILNRKRK